MRAAGASVLVLLAAPLPAQALTKAELALVGASIADLSSSDAARRLAAIDVLADHAQRARAQLEPLLGDRDPAVRHAALLVYRRAPESADPGRVAALLSDPDVKVREAAMLLLADLKPEGWAKTVSALLGRESDVRVLRQVVVALGASDDITVVPALIDALEFQRDDFMRGKVAQSLTALTGESFGTNLAVWREWWKATDRVLERKAARKSQEESEDKNQAGAKPR